MAKKVPAKKAPEAAVVKAGENAEVNEAVAATAVPAPVAKRKKKYTDVSVEILDGKNGRGLLTIERAKEILHYEQEPEGGKWGADFFTLDYEGNKIRLGNNRRNRFYRRVLAMRYANEMVRGKWTFNGESMIIDENGDAVSLQHRLTGFIFAEQIRQEDPEQWGKKELQIPALLVFGINEKDADTADLGQKRSLGDVVGRRHEFQGDKPAVLKQKSNALAVATRLVWIRGGIGKISSAPHFPHSEALDFMKAHPRLKEAVDFVFTEATKKEKNQQSITDFCPSLGYAAGLLYLMATSGTTDRDDVNFDNWDKACDFWVKVSNGLKMESGDPVGTLRDFLNKHKATIAASRDYKVGVIIKAWNAYVSGEKLTGAELKLKTKPIKDEEGKVIGQKVSEFPVCGGLDGTDATPGWSVGDWCWAWIEGEYKKAKIVSLKDETATVTPDEGDTKVKCPIDEIFGDKPEEEDASDE